MFISEEEFQRRNRTEENLVNRISQDRVEPSPLKEILPAEIPDIDLDQLLNISELPRELTKKKSLSLERLLNPTSYAGRGTKNLHRDEQAGIGIAAGIIGSAKAAALGDVAQSQAHSYKNGYTDPTTLVDPTRSPKQDLQDRIIEGHGVIVNIAFKRLLTTLNLLDDEKLGKVQKASELSIVAKNISSIIASASHATKDHITENNEKSVHFHIMRPEMAKDEEYTTLEVSTEKSELDWQEHNRS